MNCRALFYTLTTLLAVSSSQAQRPGEVWTTTRGDQTPGLRYQVATTTTSGRIVAVGGSGRLMKSDDGGTTWTFGQIEAEGVPVRGSYSQIYQVPDGNLVAVMRRLEEGGGDLFKYNVRSYFVSSGDNGETWSLSPFPKTFATFRENGRKYHGVNISGLHMGPGGELLAYGTTSGTNNGVVLWSIGGLIFRQAGETWEQAHFAYGSVSKVTDANGRAVAVSHNAILDSADGAGWNGYRIGGAQITVDGEPMDEMTRDRLRLVDVEVLGGTYIAQGGTFVPLGETNIDTNVFDKIFKMSSPTPFSGARNWTAYPQSAYYGPFKKSGSNIIASSGRGAYLTSGGGPGFTLANENVRTFTDTIAVSGATAVAVESSETVWKSTTSGASWDKVWDKDEGGDLWLIGSVDGVLYARVNNRDLWTSCDNGNSWQESPEEFNGGLTLLKGDNGRLLSPAGGNRIQVSDDGGTTWTTKTIEESRSSAFLMARSSTGRLIVPMEGKDVRNEGKFFVSDDNGDTWVAKNAGLTWNEEARAIVQTKSGRLIVPTNSFASFNPEINYSDDDGETWTSFDDLESLDGLDRVTNDPEQRVLDIIGIHASTSGRVIIMGEDEILTSDDDGLSWTVRFNFNANYEGPFLNWELRDLIQAGSRWIAVGNYRTPWPQSRNKQFLLTSDDDGTTWGQTPFETNQPNSFLYTLALGQDGRLIAAGGNASVFVSDAEPPMSAEPAALSIREGKIETVPVDRPPVDGAIEARYSTVQQTAIAGTDFKANSGIIKWAAGDTGEQTISIETIENTKIDSERQFLLQLVFETSDELVGQFQTTVSIRDNDAGQLAGLVFEGANTLYTSEAGDTATLEIALETRPTVDVTVTVSGIDASEGSLSADSFTFTPENWNQLQALTITGIDDNEPDGDATSNLSLGISTEDPSYSILPTSPVSVINTDDDPAPSAGGGFATWAIENNLPADQAGPLDDPNGDGISNLTAYAFGVSPTGPAVSIPYRINADRTLTFSVPESVSGITFGSEVSDGLGVWTPGPVPVAGASSNGFTTYTVTIPEASGCFARITFTL